ncbi:MAG: FHA domain-containing protein [Desulfobacteraceae bacterium]|nr:FHA domain-containing protein [Desulfobacteraceae bacterium]MBC2754335.1 FHA domain-containing protein [Desulfobacteraceae bacterium]
MTHPIAPPAVNVKVERGNAVKTIFCFTESFQIGRGDACDIRIHDDVVSRIHVEVSFRNDQWWLTDLKSSNGVWVDGIKVEQAPLKNQCNIMLGEDGPLLVFSIEDDHPTQKEQLIQPNESSSDELTLEHYKDHYFGDSNSADIGQHTMMVRSAFAEVKKKQKRMYLFVISVAVGLLLISGTYAVFKHLEIQKYKKLAEDIFYSMKSLELEFADILALSQKTEDAKIKKKVAAYRARQKELGKNYDRFVSALNTYENEKDEKGRLILKVARIFGECEIDIPDGFKKEVFNYIEKWKSTKRLEKAIKRAQENGYVPKIIDAMQSCDLSPQFFYLGLQESNFDVYASGPETRFGIAKGAWQFIPPTAKEYGLQVGPLSHLRIPDPNDERHNFGKSTLAAARYLRHIYNTEAQASGLLVIASYNWGEGRVVRLIRQMPKNPRDRNFWNILKDKKYKIPKETYDYVFYIFSATVIGENPRLFGFNFDNPLENENYIN